MRIYPKHSAEQISISFKAREFDCPCFGCQSTLIDVDLVATLEAMRTLSGYPINISSGYRCASHQEELKTQGCETAVGISQHQLGRAADIETGHFTGAEIEGFARQCGVKAVGVGLRFAHVDLRSDKDRRWTYTY